MVSLYLFCLIVGGGLLVFSLLGHDSDSHGGLDAHSAGGDLHGGAHGGIDSHAGHGDHFPHGWGLAKEFLSIRSLFYLLAGFGATGLLVEGLTDASAMTALAWAVATGLAAAMMAGTVYGWLKRSESGRVPETVDHLVGLPAQVVLPVLEQRRGKVRVVSSGREVELLARLYGAGDADCPRGATVVIVDIQGDTALVTPMPPLPADFTEE